MTDVVAVVPVLGRPHRVVPLMEALLDSLEEATVEMLFVASPDDEPELRELDRAGAEFLVADWPVGPADWARKINLGYRSTTAPWIFTGADDLCFCPGWADRALECAEASGATVVGTQDNANMRVIKGEHATHNLVARSYADQHGTLDGPGAVVSEVYCHNFVDDELVATAKARGVFVFCNAAEVPHLHPNHTPGVERDATYERGEREFHDDSRRFRRRARDLRRLPRV